MKVEQFRTDLRAWLDEHDLTPGPDHTLEGHVKQLARVHSALYDAGWMRYGWPEKVGGLGGPAMLRAIVGEEVVGRRLAEPGPYSMIEVLAPTMIDYAPAELAAEMVPKLLSGREQWCQGFSEPGSGSDLASLSTRAARDGDDWIVNGQKVWTSYAQYSTRCILLTRTAPGYDGITAFFVDLDTPGITIRPLRTMHGVDEFCEVYFDDVVIPAARMLGEPGDGWRLAMDLLPYERSTCFWQRIAYLYARLDELIAEAPDPDEYELGAAYLGAAHAALPVPGNPAPVGRRRATRARRPRSTRSCWPPPSSGSTTPCATCCPGRWNSTTHRGVPNTFTRERQPSTAAPPRSSATSSPADFWTWARSDGGHRVLAATGRGACARR